MTSNIIPRKSLGQHFLIDYNIARKIVALVDLNDRNTLIEIGPGQGILTEMLMSHYDVVAVELDKRCVAYLNSNFPDSKRLSVVQGDFLQLDLSLLPGTKKMTWIGNLPYQITSPILFKMLDLYPAVEKAVFMVQKEVAARICATRSTKDYGILAVLIQTFYQTRVEFKVSTHVFRPKPKVESAVVSLSQIKAALRCSMEQYQLLIKKAFNQRRKSIRNSLASLLGDFDLTSVGLDPGSRAEEISVQEWMILGNHLFQKKSPI